MSVIKTERNFVCAYEPEEGDCLVETWVRGEPQRYRLLTQPIDRYEEAVEFAVGIADQMTSPIDVMPLTAGEYLNRLGAAPQC